jgi:hypothetical protein
MYLVIQDIGTTSQHALMELSTLGAAIRACEDLREQWEKRCPGHTLCVRLKVDVVDMLSIEIGLLEDVPWPLRPNLLPEPSG